MAAPTQAQISQDDDLPNETFETVVIWGDLGFVDGSGYFSGGAGGGVLYFDQLTGDQQQILAADPKKDVRCVPGYSNQWLSTNPDTGDRHRAANAAFLLSVASLSPSQKLALGLKQFTVTYADNGTERWIIINPTGSIALLETPVSGTLVLGTGNVEPGPSCLIG